MNGARFKVGLPSCGSRAEVLLDARRTRRCLRCCGVVRDTDFCCNGCMKEMCAYAVPTCVLMDDVYGVRAYTKNLQMHDDFELSVVYVDTAGNLCVDTKIVWVKDAWRIKFIVI